MRRRQRRRPYIRLALIILSLLAMVYLGVSLYVADKLTHPTRKALTTNPGNYGLKYENVAFNSTVDNIPLKGWFIDSDSPGNKTILVLHGRDSARDNYISMEVSRALVQHGYDVFMFDFRAHGASGGDTGSIGQWETRDVVGALAYLRARGVTQVGVLGYSMGAATALLAAPDHPEMRAIVADSSFADLLSVIDRGRDKAGAPTIFDPGILLMSKVVFGLDILSDEPKQAISRLGDRPILLIHSSHDDTIPPAQAYELQKAGANDPNLQLWIAPATGHVAAFADNKEEYLARVIRFFDKYLGR